MSCGNTYISQYVHNLLSETASSAIKAVVSQIGKALTRVAIEEPTSILIHYHITEHICFRIHKAQHSILHIDMEWNVTRSTWKVVPLPMEMLKTQMPDVRVCLVRLIETRPSLRRCNQGVESFLELLDRGGHYKDSRNKAIVSGRNISWCRSWAGWDE